MPFFFFFPSFERRLSIMSKRGYGSTKRHRPSLAWTVNNLCDACIEWIKSKSDHTHWARSIQPKFQPVRPGKEDHLKRGTRFFETFPVGPNRSIEFWTEISGNFGWMDRAHWLLCFPVSDLRYMKAKPEIWHFQRLLLWYLKFVVLSKRTENRT